MSYEQYRHGFETIRLDGSFAAGGIFNGIHFSYSTLAGGNFVNNQVITDTTTAATGTVRDIIIDSATTGRLAVEAPTGAFLSGNNLQQGAVTAVMSSGSFPWGDLYALGGRVQLDPLTGLTVYTRPGLVHSIIVERPFVTAVGGTSNILVLDRLDQRIAAIPPVSGDTSSAYIPNGAATQGSYVIPVNQQCRLGIVIRFENLVPSTGLIAVVFKSFGRHEQIPMR